MNKFSSNSLVIWKYYGSIIINKYLTPSVFSHSKKSFLSLHIVYKFYNVNVTGWAPIKSFCIFY